MEEKLNTTDFTFMWVTYRWLGEPMAGIARYKADGSLCYWTSVKSADLLDGNEPSREYAVYSLSKEEEEKVIADMKFCEDCLGTHCRLLENGDKDPNGEYHGKRLPDYYTSKDRIMYSLFADDSKKIGTFERRFS